MLTLLKITVHRCALCLWDSQWAVRGCAVWYSDKVSSISLHLTYSFKQYNHGLKYVAGSSDDTIDLCKRYFKSFTVITDPNKGMLNLLQAGILLFTVLRQWERVRIQDLDLSRMLLGCRCPLITQIRGQTSKSSLAFKLGREINKFKLCLLHTRAFKTYVCKWALLWLARICIVAFRLLTFEYVNVWLWAGHVLMS